MKFKLKSWICNFFRSYISYILVIRWPNKVNNHIIDNCLFHNQLLSLPSWCAKMLFVTLLLVGCLLFFISLLYFLPFKTSTNNLISSILFRFAWMCRKLFRLHTWRLGTWNIFNVGEFIQIIKRCSQTKTTQHSTAQNSTTIIPNKMLHLRYMNSALILFNFRAHHKIPSGLVVCQLL